MGNLKKGLKNLGAVIELLTEVALKLATLIAVIRMVINVIVQ